MAKQEKSSRSGFVIKLSTETAQKIAEEEQQAKSKAEKAAINTTNDSVATETERFLNKKFETKLADSIPDDNADATKSIESTQNISLDLEDSQTKQSDTKDSVKDSEKPSDCDAEPSAASWGEYAPYITYEGEEAIYTDPTSRQRYTWSQDSNSWVTKESDASKVYSYENDTHVYTEADGSKFFWDEDKKAWIPKVDDDFLAYYQMSYGFIDNKAEEKVENKQKEEQKKAENLASGVKRKNEPQWFQPAQENNTKVYVSNLPLELTEEEFVNYMQKCGLVERDPHTQKMKVKLYMDKEQNCFKGDALCTYIKIESVDLALKLLDGGDLKGNKVRVEKAHFELKGEYNPALKPKKKKKKELEKIKKMQQKLFDWRPEKFVGERSKHERIVILKNLFHSTDFDKEVQLILDYQQDLREEAAKCGEVRKVVLYDRHPEGVAQITMKEPEMADAVVELMNGRWFGKRQITAEIWDGRTKYRIAETDADIGKRIDKWDKFLEGKDDDKSSDPNKPKAEDLSKPMETEVSGEVKPDASFSTKVVEVQVTEETNLPSSSNNEDSSIKISENVASSV